MKPIAGYDAINEAGELKSLVKGIYPLVITNIVNNEDREYLEVYYDVVKGDFKGYFAMAAKNIGRDISKEIRSYKETALPFFKAFITAVEKSNNGYSWDWDERKLIGKYIIGVFGEEEYVKDGEVKVSVKLREFRSVEAYKEGKIKVPELKKLPESERPQPTLQLETPTLIDDDLPF